MRGNGMNYCVYLIISALVCMPSINAMKNSWSESEARIIKQAQSIREREARELQKKQAEARAKNEQESKARQEAFLAQKKAQEAQEKEESEKRAFDLKIAAANMLTTLRNTERISEAHVLAELEDYHKQQDLEAIALAAGLKKLTLITETKAHTAAAQTTETSENLFLKAIVTDLKDLVGLSGDIKESAKAKKEAEEKRTAPTTPAEKVTETVPAKAIEYIAICDWENLFKNFSEEQIISFFSGAPEQFNKPDITTSIYPVQYAALYGWLHLVTTFVNKKIRVNVVAKTTGLNTLQYAMMIDGKTPTAKKICGQITALLVTTCSDTDFINYTAPVFKPSNSKTVLFKNVTPLFMAVCFNQPFGITALIAAGANKKAMITKIKEEPHTKITNSVVEFAKKSPHSKELVPLFTKSARHKQPDAVDFVASMFV